MQIPIRSVRSCNKWRPFHLYRSTLSESARHYPAIFLCGRGYASITGRCSATAYLLVITPLMTPVEFYCDKTAQNDVRRALAFDERPVHQGGFTSLPVTGTILSSSSFAGSPLSSTAQLSDLKIAITSSSFVKSLSSLTPPG